ncbi:Phosphatidylinositol 3-kinase VPS34 [Quillaja saponaria]|uniref:Phosphatidylinositol 3-kinase VPS34 n=1 Tax=Quillaja saponaria TaxID=32244 RepID=A0AAD7L9V3_QUISA|nr:Phosphatidylinositol 3-kinase VPS34 [Quillaja saponaria]
MGTNRQPSSFLSSGLYLVVLPSYLKLVEHPSSMPAAVERPQLTEVEGASLCVREEDGTVHDTRTLKASLQCVSDEAISDDNESDYDEEFQKDELACFRGLVLDIAYSFAF